MGEGLAAVVLAGGLAKRLGGADKPGISIGGRSLVGWVAAAASAAGASQLIIVGPPRPGLEAAGVTVHVTSEHPAGSGPVPALRAGLRLVAQPWLLVLAADTPFLRERHLRALVQAAGPKVGAVLADDRGRPQWMCGCWRTADLRAALTGYQRDSLRGVLEPLRPVLVTITVGPAEPPPWIDCDSPPAIAAALAWADRCETTSGATDDERRQGNQHGG